MLTCEENATLIIQAKSGDSSAKEKLIEINSPLIKSIVKRYKNKGIDYEDLYQLGCMGFVKAINNFSDEFGVKFSTYAVPMIAGEIKRFLRDDGSVKVSRSIKHNALIIKKYVDSVVSKYGYEPTIDEIANHFNIEIQDVVWALDANTNTLSIDDKTDDDDLSIGDKVVSDFSPEKLVDKIAIRDMIKGLNAREKRIIILRYYLDKTQSEIAQMMGVSQVQISRIENKILASFRNNLTGIN